MDLSLRTSQNIVKILGISLEYLKKLSNSMPRRLQMVLKHKGEMA